MPPDSRERTAYHEAGHAVIAIRLGRAVHRLSILPKLQTAGRCEFQSGKPRPTADSLEREMLILLAGLAAESKHAGIHAWDGAKFDLQMVERLAVMRAGEKQAGRLIKRMLSKVEHMLSQTEAWTAVERIAAELLRQETISGRAVMHLISQCHSAE